MTSGLFSFLCPHCATDLCPDGDGRHSCPSCGAAYSVLFGCLVRSDDPTDALSTAAAPPPAAQGPVSLAS